MRWLDWCRVAEIRRVKGGASSFASSSSLRSSALRVNTTLLKGEQLHTFPRLLSGWSAEQKNYARGPVILGHANKGRYASSVIVIMVLITTMIDVIIKTVTITCIMHRNVIR